MSASAALHPPSTTTGTTGLWSVVCGLWTQGAVLGLGLLGTGALWCWRQIRLLGDVRFHLGVFYGWFAAAFVLYLMTLWYVRRMEQVAQSPPSSFTGILLTLLIAALARLVLLDTPPTLSDDIYRYRWDGRVQQAGIDPYAYAPNDAALAFLHDEQFSHINFPHLRTVYPPLTEAAFRLGVRLGDTLTAQKAVFVLAELVTVGSLLFILWRRGRSLLWVAAYTWHPLVILEVAGSGHNDSLGVAALWLGLAAWEARFWFGGTLAWLGAFLSKFFSMILVPWWWYRRTARGWLAAFLFLSVGALVWHYSAVTAVIESFSAMASRGSSNASLYLAIAALAGRAKAALGVALGLGTVFLLWWARREADPLRYLLGGATAAALLAPALHPWYLVWLVPFLCFWRVPAILALTGTVVLSYTVWPGRLAGGNSGLPVWAHVLEYAPVFVLLVVGALRYAWRPKAHPLDATNGPAAPSRRPRLSEAHDATRRVAVIIPCRNEAEALGHVLAEIPRAAVHEIIVVDNGSTDQTAAVAARGRARVVQEPRAGYGRACLAGITALDPSVDTVVFMDGDHSDDAEDLPGLLEPIEQGTADFVVGSRAALAEPGSLTIQQRVGNRLACALMRWLFGARYTDLGPFRAIRREALAQLAMADQAFGWTVEMQAKAAVLGLRVVEVPVRYRPRIGRSKISGTINGTIRAGVAILSTILKIAFGSGLWAQGSGQLPPAPSPQPSAKRLLIFLKYPTPGQVKTRLAASVGTEAATNIYRACTELTLERLAQFRKDTIVCVHPPEAVDRTRQWLGAGWLLRSQHGTTLGERLAHAMGEAFASGAARVAAIGTDSPWLEARDLDAAFAALDGADVVIGPAQDGGYYLIGLSREAPELFDGVAWGSSAVYAQTLAKARTLGLQVTILRPGYDVDQLDDVRRFLSEARGRSTASEAVNIISDVLDGALVLRQH